MADQCRIKDRKACDLMSPEMLHDFCTWSLWVGLLYSLKFKI